MFVTQCSNCRRGLPVRAFQLRQAGGVVVCPHCRKVFNALLSLADATAEPNRAPAAGNTAAEGMPPVLEKLPDQAGNGSETTAAEPPGAYDSGAQARRREGETSPAVAVMLAALPVLIALLVWQLATMPTLGNGKVNTTMAHLPGAGAFRIVSRDLHRHPTQPGFRMFSFRLRNISDSPRRLPGVELAWPSGESMQAGAHRLQPATYAAAANASLAAGGEHGGLVMIKSAIDEGALNVRIR